jgi:hypothetical protein
MYAPNNDSATAKAPTDVTVFLRFIADILLPFVGIVERNGFDDPVVIVLTVPS